MVRDSQTRLRHERTMRTRLLLIVTTLVTLGVALPGFAAQAAPESAGNLEIVALSNRADLVSGGDVLLEVRLPPGTDAAAVTVSVDGRDVTPAFALRDDGRFVGL